MHGTIELQKPFSGVMLFNSADDMLAAIFGAPQHNHHVKARDLHNHNQAVLAEYDRRNDAVAAHVQVMIARMRAARAA